jgi:beta-lactamase superfamily II metal-dependent hydrolase
LAAQGVTLAILGPRKGDLRVSAELILRETDALLEELNTVFRGNDALDDARAYHNWIGAAYVQRIGKYVNLQSLVTLFTYQEKKLLFMGDMQVADPQTTDADLLEGVRYLLESIETNGPYDFVKLAHHGSWNGTSDEVFEHMHTPPLVGICAGAGSTRHPAPETLELLWAHRDTIRWVRTDHNGLVSIALGDGLPELTLARGRVNDAIPPEPWAEQRMDRLEEGLRVLRADFKAFKAEKDFSRTPSE